MGFDASQLYQLLSQYVDQKLSRVSAEEHGWLEAAVQDFSLDGPILKIESGIIVDFSDLDSVRERLSFEQIDSEFGDESSWEKWRAIEPTFVADLQRVKAIAMEVSNRYGIKVAVELLHAEVYFVAEVSDDKPDGLLSKGYLAVDALFEAWSEFGAWLRGAERLRVVRKSGKHKRFLDSL